MTVASTDSTHPVTAATLAVSGAASGQYSCTHYCTVFGEAGHYTLSVSATGFQTVEQSVDVADRQQSGCGCGGVQTQDVLISLQPTGP